MPDVSKRITADQISVQSNERGAWFTIGRPTEVDGKVTVCICEGYATGASVHEATLSLRSISKGTASSWKPCSSS